MSTHLKFLEGLKPPVLIAHRGSQVVNHYPENTLPAFEEALQVEAHGIELDIWLTSDGELAVFHDRNLDRLIGSHQQIDHCSSHQLQQLRFTGYEANPEIKIPMLHEVFARFGGKLYYNIEIKHQTGSYRKLVQRLQALLQEYDLASRVWLSSFDARFLREWIATNSPVPCALLFSKWNWFIRRHCSQPYPQILHPSVALIPRLPDLLRFSKPLCFWTVNQEETLKEILHPAVFGIISDNIPLIKRCLGALKL